MTAGRNLCALAVPGYVPRPVIFPWHEPVVADRSPSFKHAHARKIDSREMTRELGVPLSGHAVCIASRVSSFRTSSDAVDLDAARLEVANVHITAGR